MNAVTIETGLPDDSDLERSVVRKCFRYIALPLAIAYVLQALDRLNVAYAALRMNDDLGLGAAAFGFGAGLFFITYFLFSVPSNLALIRFGARRWLMITMVAWGVMSVALAFVQGETSFYVVRLLLGAAEAGFAPTMIYLVGAWFPASYRGRTLALLSAIGPFTAVFGGPLSGLILNLEAWGLKGWQWMFILEGGPTIIFGFFMYYLMRNGIDDAEWLEPGEKQWLRDRLARESVSPANEDGAFKLRYLLDPRILTLGLTFFGSASVGFSVMFFLPQITKEFGLGDLDALLLAALPPASGVIAMLLWGRHSDKTGERIKHGLAALAVSAIGGFVTSMSSDPTIRITGLCVMLAGAYAFLPCFWSIPSTIFSGATAAAAIAMIQSVGNISGFVGPSIMGAVKQHTGNFNLGLQIASIFAVMGMVALLASMQVVERHARRTAEAPSAA